LIKRKITKAKIIIIFGGNCTKILSTEYFFFVVEEGLASCKGANMLFLSKHSQGA